MKVMYNVFIILVPIITGTLIIILLFLLAGKRSEEYADHKDAREGAFSTTCPLCGSGLRRGERVKSVLFPGKPDSIMEIHGCRYCYPPNKKVKRICPVCKKELGRESVVIARVFERPGRKHVHVLGCTECYKRKY